MFEKVNPMHPDKIADRIAGAMIDMAYAGAENPRVAVEVLIGHGKCMIIAETSHHFNSKDVEMIVERITRTKNLVVEYIEVPQDSYLASNQLNKLRCGDNGIFRGVPVTKEQKRLSDIARKIYSQYPYDGKYILDEDNNRLVVCQSNAQSQDLIVLLSKLYLTGDIEVNPLGYWTGGPDVDSGATNRKLGSDMADSITGGGLMGKDLSKADVSINIYAWLLAQKTGKPVELCCAIGDEEVDGKPYSEIVEIAREYINSVGGFEKFAEWGLV